MSEEEVHSTYLLANPNSVRKMQTRHNSVPGQTAPKVSFASRQPQPQEEEDDGEEYEYEPEDGEEYEYEEEEEEEEDDEPGQGGGVGGVRQRVEDMHASMQQEKIALLTELDRFAAMNNNISEVIPKKTYNLQSDLTELREIVSLCQQLYRNKQNQASIRMGVKQLNSATCWLARTMEAANVNLLDPDTQFALDGYGDDVKGRIDEGEFQEVHEQMWERLRPYLGSFDNPFVQWGLMMGMGAATYIGENKKAYAEGRREDPRVRRKQLMLEQLEAEREAEEEEREEEYEQGVNQNRRESLMAASLRNKVNGAASRPVAPMEHEIEPADFPDSDDDLPSGFNGVSGGSSGIGVGLDLAI